MLVVRFGLKEISENIYANSGEGPFAWVPLLVHVPTFAGM